MVPVASPHMIFVTPVLVFLDKIRDILHLAVPFLSPLRPAVTPTGIGMNRLFSVNRIILHDVDLTTIGPCDPTRVGTEHPNGRPVAQCAWNLGTNLYPHILPAGTVLTGILLHLADNRSRRIAVVFSVYRRILLKSRDDQVAVLHVGILTFGGVTLCFIVTMTLIIAPIFRFWNARVVELIMKDQLISRICISNSLIGLLSVYAHCCRQ